MKLVTVEDLKEGDILASDVLLEDYTVVLGKGTEIKEQYIEKLRELDIFTVYIEEDYSDDITNDIELEFDEITVPDELLQIDEENILLDEPNKEIDFDSINTPQQSLVDSMLDKAQKDQINKEIDFDSINKPQQSLVDSMLDKAQKDQINKEIDFDSINIPQQSLVDSILNDAEKEQTIETDVPVSKPDLKIPLEEIKILKSDVEQQVKSRIKDILELHVYQRTDGLKKIADTAEKIITDILEEDVVVERVYDVKERNADIYDHSIEVCTIATLIALKMGMTEKEVYDISEASLIHDLGLRYLVVKYEDQDINLLPTKDQDEYKKHPIYGYTALKNEQWISKEAKDIVLAHHERKDGSGYPLGTKKCSRSSQIVGICDEFDELICGIGKAKVRVHEAINTIRNYSGIWFDRDIVKNFLSLIAVYPVGSKVRTNKGETAIVMRQNSHFPERPVLRVISDVYGQAINGEKVIDLIKDTSVVIQEVIK
ncbi:MAG: HD domain-containing phosphohydrolase [Lachnospiraceae bacterium]|nr:HD domain-containing phosphohydrolase [Lachnospiraceae bacterium]